MRNSLIFLFICSDSDVIKFFNFQLIFFIFPIRGLFVFLNLVTVGPSSDMNAPTRQLGRLCNCRCPQLGASCAFEAQRLMAGGRMHISQDWTRRRRQMHCAQCTAKTSCHFEEYNSSYENAPFPSVNCKGQPQHYSTTIFDFQASSD